MTSARRRAYMGKERHDLGREDDLGYPVRCVRTPQYLYVRNFAPDRWPAGNPETGFTNCDSSPTKTRILELKEQEEKGYWNLCFGKRPAEELYDVVADPYCLTNLAQSAEFTHIREELWEDLKTELERSGDPRIFGEGDTFEHTETAGDPPHSWEKYREGTWQPQAY